MVSVTTFLKTIVESIADFFIHILKFIFIFLKNAFDWNQKFWKNNSLPREKIFSSPISQKNDENKISESQKFVFLKN